MRLWFLKLHRWLALLFALPLLIVIGSGLVLSFEPWLVVRAIEPASLDASRIESWLKQHDPAGQARAIAYRSYDKTLTIGGGRSGGTVIDTATGEARPSPSVLANFLVSVRRLHEALLIDAGWLVIASTAVMLVLALLGVLMGWPRITNTLSGWHKAIAWGLLPLIVLSPLTALFMASGVTFAGSSPAAAGARVSLAEGVRIVGERHDLSTLVWMRPLGGRLAARLVEDGEYRLYAVTREGTVALPRNWPRLWHEGNFAGGWSAALNVLASAAMLGLLVTGPWIWLRRRLRRPAAARSTAAA